MPLLSRRRGRISKDYAHQRLDNPYFDHDHPKRPDFDTLKYLKILGLVLALYLIGYSDLFKIREVTISGTDLIDAHEIRGVVDDQLARWRWWLVPQKSALWFNTGELRDRLEHTYSLSHLSIDKGWRSLTIDLEEKIAFVIVYNQRNFYFVDETGNSISEIPTERIADYWYRFPIVNIGSRDVTIGEHMMNSALVTSILRLHQLTQEHQIIAQGYELNGVEDVTLVTRQGWRAYFSSVGDLERSFENMQIVLQEKVTDRNALNYIDVRFGDKIYFKNK